MEAETSQPPERLAHGDALLRACRRILRPIVKALIAHGITLPAVIALLKQAYVEVAVDSFHIEGKPMTDSRVSLLTGVHRKDVRTLRETGVPATAPPGMSIGAAVIGRWLGDRRYTSEDGRPKPLPRAGGPDLATFNALVAEISADIRPRTVQDELERQGLVAFDAEADEVRLLVDAFVPQSDDPAIFDLFAGNLHDHAAAGVENLLAPRGKAPFLERAVFYGGLSAGAAAALEAKARQLASAALAELNAEALARRRDEEGSAGPKRRFRFGLYFYETSHGQAGIPPAAEPPDPGRE